MSERRDFQPSMAVVNDCRSYLDLNDAAPEVVRKAAGEQRLTLDEVGALDGEISPNVAAWKSKVLSKFGGGSELSSSPREQPFSPAGKNAAVSVVFRGRIAKQDESRRLVFGWASVAEIGGELVVDKQGDIIQPQDLEDAAYEFVLHSREGDVMHDGIQASALVASIVTTKDIQSAMGVETDRVGWFVGFKVFDDEAWEQVRKGELSEFSIEAVAQRIPVAEAA